MLYVLRRLYKSGRRGNLTVYEAVKSNATVIMLLTTGKETPTSRKTTDNTDNSQRQLLRHREKTSTTLSRDNM